MCTYVERYDDSNRITYVKSEEDGRYTAWTYKRHDSLMFNIKYRFKTIFLPDGYPDSVSDDYMDYQLWDTLQAFASSLTGSLATYAVLEGIGVGDKDANALAAAMTWILKDGVGHIGRILFAWMKGTDLDCNCKQWRLFADILNDLAICLNLVLLLFPLFVRTTILCVSNLALSIVGVAGGATRASLTQHQARKNNMADVSAKDGSQETLVNLMALIVNLAVLPLITDALWKIWSMFLVFTLIHLFANYRAVRSLNLDTFNRARLYIVTKAYLSNQRIMTVKEANQKEFVLPGFIERDNVVFGSSLKPFVNRNSTEVVENAFEILERQKYFIYLYNNGVHVVLCNVTDSKTQIKAYINAVMMAQGNEKAISFTEQMLNYLSLAGWNLEKNLLNPNGPLIHIKSLS